MILAEMIYAQAMWSILGGHSEKKKKKFLALQEVSTRSLEKTINAEIVKAPEGLR